MGIQAIARPSVLQFGAQRPGTEGPDISTFGEGELVLPSFAGAVQVEAPSNATVSVRIQDNNGVYAIRDAFLLEFIEVFVGGDDPDVGHHVPPHKMRVLEAVATFDGSTPINVKQGQILMVRVRYSVPSAP